MKELEQIFIIWRSLSMSRRCRLDLGVHLYNIKELESRLGAEETPDTGANLYQPFIQDTPKPIIKVITNQLPFKKFIFCYFSVFSIWNFTSILNFQISKFWYWNLEWVVSKILFENYCYSRIVNARLILFPTTRLLQSRCWEARY